jgi:hypothetical protein
MYTEMSVTACLASFSLTFAALIFLAVVMRVITMVFPPVKKDGDSAWMSAINSAYAGAFPGTKITKIQAK